MRLPAKIIDTLKKDILGKDYELSIAFVDAEKSQELNKKYRKKDRPTNVLSFSLSPNTGELVLCEEVIKKEAEDSGKDFKKWLGFLVIHGMLHLKGMTHGSIMEKQEAKYDQKYFNRNRRGVKHDSRISGRVRKGRKNS